MIYIYLPSKDSSAHRGGGRYIELLKEAFENSTSVNFTNNLENITDIDTLVIPFWNPFAAPLIKKRYCKNQILVIFDIIPQKYPEHFPIGIRGTFTKWVNNFSLRNFDHIITISDHSKNDIAIHLKIPSKKIHTVHLTFTKIFDNEGAENSTQKSADVLKKYDLKKNSYCMYVGDVNWNKNIATLAHVIQTGPIPCVFVGKAFSESFTKTLSHPWQKELREFRNIAQQKPDNFKFPGYVPDEDLKILYQNALCNILLSRDEGFGLSYLEAATQKCPSILMDNDIFREIAFESAFFVANEQECSYAIQHLQSNVEARNKMGFLASKRAHEVFNQKRFTMEMMEVFKSNNQ